jgi:purine-nucleoside phosphorylase
MNVSLTETVAFIKDKGFEAPEVGIVLGTGLGKMADMIEIELTLEYSEIPHFPLATVEFHKGRLIYGRLGNKKVVAMQGRFHLYEGYAADEVVFPIRVMKLLGIKNLIISNAAGSLNPAFDKGDIMVIEDHINLLSDHPLRGPNNDHLGPRFPDMSAPYQPALRKLIEEIAKEQLIRLQKGVYAAVMGPNLETRAEYGYLKVIGADAVGMSTVPEVIAAVHMGLPCCAFSVITDLCNPDALEPVKIEDIIANAAKGEQTLAVLIPELVSRL